MPPSRTVLSAPVAVKTRSKIVVGTLIVCAIALLGAFGASMAGIIKPLVKTVYFSPMLTPDNSSPQRQIYASFPDGRGKIMEVSYVPGMANCVPGSISITEAQKQCKVGDYAKGSSCNINLLRNINGKGRCVLKISYSITRSITDSIVVTETRYFEQNSMASSSTPGIIKEVINPAPTPTNLCGGDSGQPNSDGPAMSWSYLCTESAACTVSKPTINHYNDTWNWTCSLVDVGVSKCSAPVAPTDVSFSQPKNGDTWVMGETANIQYSYSYPSDPNWNPTAYISLVKNNGIATMCYIGQQPAKTGLIAFTLSSKIKCGPQSTPIVSGKYQANVIIGEGVSSSKQTFWYSASFNIIDATSTAAKCYYSSSTVNVPSGSTGLGYIQPAGTCGKYSALCTNGNWSINGSNVPFFFNSCVGMANCLYADDNSSPARSGITVNTYSAPVVTSTCSVVLRTCTNGVWSGTGPAYFHCVASAAGLDATGSSIGFNYASFGFFALSNLPIVKVGVNFGTSISYGKGVICQKVSGDDNRANFSCILPNLNPATNYHYKAYLIDSSAQIYNEMDKVFTTAPTPKK